MIKIALRKTVECFFIPFCCFVYLQSLPRYLPKYIYLFILPLCEKCRLKCRDKANSCLIIRFSSSTSEEYPALGCFFLLCLRLRLLLPPASLLIQLLSVFSFPWRDCDCRSSSRKCPKTAAKCGRGTARKGWGECEGERGRERDRIERKNFKCRRRQQVLRHYHYYFFILFVFSLFYIIFFDGFFFSCSTYPKKVAHNSEDILLFRNSSHTHRGRGRREEGKRGTDQMQRLMQLPVCFQLNATFG